MAKKMLINPDILLATPRRSEPPPVVEIPPVQEQSKPQPLVVETPPVQEQPKPQQAVVATPSVPPSTRGRDKSFLPNQVQKEPVQQQPIRSVQQGLKTGETRATFIVQETALEKIKAIAYWDRVNIKEVMQAALDAYITAYEHKNGSIKPI